uniref:Uncharacterized protein n=1 Tax=Timema genevievae TaxID=629358 RepID=A0A7R9JWC1_TIMGE|nr:unnamed protein product [Timema genevievae]
MGKFPGKPSKTLNRKRVKVENCPVSQENDSLKAAENIYLRLAVFNEIFGNDKQAGRQFNGFTSQEIELAISLVKKTYSKDLDVDCKLNENKNVRLWDSFSKELQNLPSDSKFRPNVSKSEKTNNSEETDDESFDVGGKKNGIGTSKIPLKSSLHSDTSRSIQSSSKDTSKSSDSIVCDDESCDSDELTEYDPSKKSLDPSLWSCSSGGKVILRKARLKLKSPVAKSIVDGPFSATTSRPSSASSSTPGTVICGVCGAVRFYRFVKQARKFKILCCESCRKFISKIMRRQMEAMPPVGCQRGDGKCTVPPILRSQQWRATNKKISCAYKARCPACWLKMCLQAFKMPENLHKKLTRMLPSYMRKPPFIYIKQEKTSTASAQEESAEITGSSPNHFIKLEPFHDEEMNDKRHKRKAALDSFIKITPNRQVEEKKKKKRVDAIGSHKQKRLTHIRTSKILKKAAKNLSKSKEDKFSSRSLKKKAKEKNKKVNGSKVRKKAGSLSGVLDDSRRQCQELKGPRVKHVCRSASIVLGQSQATFPPKIIEKKPVKSVQRSVKVPKKNKGHSNHMIDKHSAKHETERIQNNHIKSEANTLGMESSQPVYEIASISSGVSTRETSPLPVARSKVVKQPAPVLPPLSPAESAWSLPPSSSFIPFLLPHYSPFFSSCPHSLSVRLFLPPCSLMWPSAPILQHFDNLSLLNLMTSPGIRAVEAPQLTLACTATERLKQSWLNLQVERITINLNLRLERYTLTCVLVLVRTLPISNISNVPEPQLQICIDFWESYDPEEVSNTGFALIGSEPFSVRALCFLCGSAGHEKLIHCASCCEPYHPFCVEDGYCRSSLANCADEWRCDWVCRRCTMCHSCGQGLGQQVSCQRCHKIYHIECLGTDRITSRVHSPDRPWICSACLRCKSCGKADVTVFVGNLPLCNGCFKLRQKDRRLVSESGPKRIQIPVPQSNRTLEQGSRRFQNWKLPLKHSHVSINSTRLRQHTEMMECGQCKSWVHAKCEGLSDEKYQVLSYLPESVEFVCRLCCTLPPAPWWFAVEEELKAGFLDHPHSFEVEGIDPGIIFSKDSSSDITETDGSVKNQRQQFLLKDYAACVKNVYTKPVISSPISIQVEDQLSGLSPDSTFSDVYLKSPNKTLMVSMATPPSDSGIGSTDDELKLSTEEETEEVKDGLAEIDFISNVECALPTKLTPTKQLEPVVVPDKSPLGLDASKTEGFAASRDCYCAEASSGKLTPTLLRIRKKISSNEYSSLLQFHQEMEHIINVTHHLDLVKTYHNALIEVFPWFDPKLAKVSSKNTGKSILIASPSKSGEHPSDKPLLEDSQENLCREVSKFNPPKGDLKYYYSDHIVEDMRTCMFCKGLGDGLPTREGRLLYCGQNGWTHANCALWSAEVFEEIDGSLQNVHSAISRGRMIRCRLCGKKGASVGCCTRNCAETYHFYCALKNKCALMDDKTVFCPSHRKDASGKRLTEGSDFDLARPIYVELDRKKKKYVEPNIVRFMIGSLIVENLGEFVARVSDNSEAIIPMEFCCTRLYWSSLEPWRIVRYNMKITMRTCKPQESQDLGKNITVDHTKEKNVVDQVLREISQWHHDLNNSKDQSDDVKVNCDLFISPSKKNNSCQTDTLNVKAKRNFKFTEERKVAREVLDHILDSVCREVDDSLTDPQNSADLLPPELKDAIFEDLPHDLLDGISMQDIFPKLMNVEEVSTAETCFATESLKEGKELGEEALLSSDIEAISVISNNQDISLKNIRSEAAIELASQTDLWFESNDCKDETSLLEDECFITNIPKEYLHIGTTKDIKRSKSDGIPQQIRRKLSCGSLSQHRSCSLTWSCKLDGPHKRRKGSRLAGRGSEDDSSRLITTAEGAGDKAHRLQELRMPSIASTVAEGVRELKYCFEDDATSSEGAAGVRRRPTLPKEEGKENKCMSWNDRLLQKLPQLDGAIDSSSSSEEGSPPRDNYVSEFTPHRTLLYAPSVIEANEEEPVRCDRCHRTYRTRTSFERHLPTCSSDFILSTSESDSENARSSEEEGVKYQPTTISSSKSVFSPQKNVISSGQSCIIEESPTQLLNQPSECLNNVKPVFDSNIIPTTKSQTKQKPIPKPILINGRQRGRAVNKQKLSAIRQQNHSSMMNHSLSPHSQQVHPIIHCQPQSNPQQQSPTVIMQQMASPNMMAAYIDAFQQQTGQSLQYIATVDAHNNGYNKAQFITAAPNTLLSGTYQLPEGFVGLQNGGISVIPSMQLAATPSTVLGTLIQPQPTLQCGVVSADQMVLGSTGGMFLTAQPMYYGLETIVSNTVMQSSQFVSASVPGVMAASSSFSTTTQVFQASKLEPIIDVPSGFVIVNPHAPLADTTLGSSDIITCTPSTVSMNVSPSVTVPQPPSLPPPPALPPPPPPQVHIPISQPPPPLPTPRPSVPLIQPNVQTSQAPWRYNYNSPQNVYMASPKDNDNYTSSASQHLRATFPVEKCSCRKSETLNFKPPVTLPIYVSSPHTASTTRTQSSITEQKSVSSASVQTSAPVTLARQPVTPIQRQTRLIPELSPQSKKIPEKTNKVNGMQGFSIKSLKMKPLVCVSHEISKKEVTTIPVPKTQDSANNESKESPPNRSNGITPHQNVKIIVPLKDKKLPNDYLPNVTYEIHSQDGFVCKSSSITEVWQKVFEAVQEARKAHKMPPLPRNPFDGTVNGLQMLGLKHNGLRYLVEQLPGAARCFKYKPRFHKQPPIGVDKESRPCENLSGCARAERFKTRSPYDMFGWLASRHRKPPKLLTPTDNDSAISNRRATSTNLPMAMRFRYLKETSKEAVGVYRSHIHGRGLFCLRNIELGEMVIEYAGEVIRSTLTDKREKYYESKDIGCYMFRIDDHLVVDATMRGNAARFINHSCEISNYETGSFSTPQVRRYTKYKTTPWCEPASKGARRIFLLGEGEGDGRPMGLGKNHPQFTRLEIRTSISPSSAVKLNTTSALANYATEAGP